MERSPLLPEPRQGLELPSQRRWQKQEPMLSLVRDVKIVYLKPEN
jgi:hypothetical protein